MRDPRDIAIGVFFLALSGVLLFAIQGFPSGTLAEGMGARLMPLVLTLCLAFLSLLLLLHGFRSGRYQPGENLAPAGRALDPPLLGPHLKTPGILIALLTAYLLGLEYAGFLAGNAVFLLLATRSLGATWKGAAKTSLFLTVLTYLIFGVALDVPLPAFSLLAR